jgi:hypothetical protein
MFIYAGQDMASPHQRHLIQRSGGRLFQGAHQEASGRTLPALQD